MREKIEAQNSTNTSQFKAELWTIASGPGEGSREVWATVMLDDPDKDWPCAFGPKDKMENYARRLNETNGSLVLAPGQQVNHL